MLSLISTIRSCFSIILPLYFFFSPSFLFDFMAVKFQGPRQCGAVALVGGLVSASGAPSRFWWESVQSVGSGPRTRSPSSAGSAPGEERRLQPKNAIHGDGGFECWLGRGEHRYLCTSTSPVTGQRVLVAWRNPSTTAPTTHHTGSRYYLLQESR